MNEHSNERDITEKINEYRKECLFPSTLVVDDEDFSFSEYPFGSQKTIVE